MSLNASKIRLDSVRKCDVYWKGISDRIRTLCLGALVLVWGVFSQKREETGLLVTVPEKELLLAAAALAVIVIAFDFAEYLFGVQLQANPCGRNRRIAFISLRNMGDANAQAEDSRRAVSVGDAMRSSLLDLTA